MVTLEISNIYESIYDVKSLLRVLALAMVHVLERLEYTTAF